MIKNIWLLDEVPALAPTDVPPVRTALCVALPEVTPDPRFAAVLIEWFTDAAHRDRHDAVLAAPRTGQLVVAREHALRGADWLARRWHDGGPALKHVAVARRAPGLTPQEFSDRWRNRAGRVGAVPIPEPARGLAYVQNHPLPGDHPFDAVNEVYFDDLDGLRTRVDWFAANVDGEDDLVGEHWFLAVREELHWTHGFARRTAAGREMDAMRLDDEVGPDDLHLVSRLDAGAATLQPDAIRRTET